MSRRVLGLILLAVGVVAIILISLAFGTRQIAFDAVVAAILDPDPSNNDHDVVRDLRVPRTIIGLLAGAALAVAGGIMQGLTRNPLADPGLLGVNAGASLFVVLGITFLGVTAASGYIWFAFAGAAAATVLVYAVGSGRRGSPTPVTLTLSGAAVTAVLTSAITLVLLSNLDTLNQYRFWSVGSLVGRDLSAVSVVVPFLGLGLLLAAIVSRMLNVLALGDDVARGLGQNVMLARVLAGIAIVILCGGATAIAGPIVFVGLVVPHIVRRFTGPDYRWILAYSVLLGPILLVLADVVGRLIVQPTELEAGIVVAFLGAPMLIALVRRSRVGAL
ncbi:FecCD family ABC transporter permease [Glaciihabitans arcticus]|uniref:FecCD family ABC transporter permease n=1 Tax=Glaciihabitans arcticus TaxID=2668039 RepID=UPI001F001D90|nr:iron chelate uptake ABC transporter family permease subunit [Glaciihabitans arcticus]